MANEADIRREVEELARRGDHAGLIRLLEGVLPDLGCPHDLTIVLFEVCRRTGGIPALVAAARRLLRRGVQPTLIAREAARRLPLEADETLALLRRAVVLSPGDAANLIGLVFCLDRRRDFASAVRNARRHEVTSGQRGRIVTRMVHEAWQGQRWQSVVEWLGRLIGRFPERLRLRFLLQNAVEKACRDHAFPGPFPIAEMVDRHLPPGERTSVLFVGARGEDLVLRFRGIPANRLEVIGVDPELGDASKPGAAGIALRYLRDALSDRDGERTFYEAHSGGGSSLFRRAASAARYTNPAGLNWGDMLAPKHSYPVRTTSVDAIRARGELGRLDALYANIQGGELAVLRGGRETFADTVAVQVEVSFIALYEGAPDWREVDREMVEQGFVLVDIRNFNSAGRTKVGFEVHLDNKLGYDRWPSWQMAEAQLLYLRDPTEPVSRQSGLFRSARDWLVFALWAEHYGQIDIALEALMTLVEEPDRVDDPERVTGLAPEVEVIAARYRAYFRTHYP